MPLKRKRNILLGAVSQAYKGVTTRHTSFTEGFPLFTWLLKVETVAQPLLIAVLHVPYVRAAVPFPNHKWLGHVCTDQYISCACTHGHLHCRRSLWMVGRMPSCVTRFEGGTLIDAVRGLYLKSTQAKWYAPRVQSTCVKYVGLIFINFKVVVIWVIQWCFTKRDLDVTVLKLDHRKKKEKIIFQNYEYKSWKCCYLKFPIQYYNSTDNFH